MKKTIALLATLLRTFADELDEKCSGEAAPETPTPAAPKSKRGRPALSKVIDPDAAPASEPEKEPEPEKEQEPEGMSLESLKALIEPAIKAQAGLEVKKIITKHGGTSLSTIPATNHAAFVKDIEEMVY